jgi:ribosome-binding protein aMBF1 (putative translation factor)
MFNRRHGASQSNGRYTFDKASKRKYNDMRRAHPYSPQTVDAVQVLGLEVARARRTRRWTEAELAERAGISAVTLRNIERGVPTVGIGTVFEVATILGIDLFGAGRDGLRSMVERGRDRLAPLPSRVRRPTWTGT